MANPPSLTRRLGKPMRMLASYRRGAGGDVHFGMTLGARTIDLAPGCRASSLATGRTASLTIRKLSSGR